MAQPKLYGEWTKECDGHLGDGGNGTVWRVTNKNKLQGAIKLLHKKVLQENDRLVRFLHEIELMKQCSDVAGVLPILDSYSPDTPSKDDPPWLVTPIASPLDTVLKQGLNTDECVSLCCDLSHTLMQLHERNISHRDIKPENIFMYEDEWCLGDFGLADSPDKTPITKDDNKLGPLFYIAPEMLNDASEANGCQADVYSLGKLLWVVVSGQKYPIPGEHKLDNSYSLVSYTGDKRTHLLDGLIEKCS